MKYTSDAVLIWALSIITATLFLASLMLGAADLSLPQLINAALSTQDTPVSTVLWEIRVPRALLGVITGATLGLSGAVLQGLLRNPLAEPGLIGVSSSASLGAVIAIYTGITLTMPFALPIFALASAGIAAALLPLLAGGRGQTLTLILAGVAISSIATALTSLALNLSPNPFAAMEIVFWMLGSLNDRSMQHLYIIAPFIMVGWGLLFVTGKGLNALSLGEETAHTMGVSLPTLRFCAIAGTAASVGAVTAVTGTIGFIGLIVPHLLRKMVDDEPARLLLPSALAGACLLTLADIAVKLFGPQSNLKLGVLTALVGAPFFLWLILKQRRALI
ncbi:Hemin transport system permease protein HmuU [Pseudovibrio axinellae]|uniref:Hemin transport system permease protein HmuU n=1 Tax=Pseudovibrio axinellae TaxID=989403 RepID=A0A165UM43_9HYPH|nr:iron ABC transporter permease [Pseudovibrio axinellae]KZL12541.1 Hemin transport system permease protein HmuU [Pseudovibrio axinellae]SEP67786.1 iron complex transport system permease protein [Pseudovibrio axinellae]